MLIVGYHRSGRIWDSYLFKKNPLYS